MPPMKSVRAKLLPAHAKNAHYSTIAKLEPFRRFLVPGDTKKQIKYVMIELYKAAGNASNTHATERKLAVAAEKRHAPDKQAARHQAARMAQNALRLRRDRQRLDRYTDSSHTTRQGDTTQAFAWAMNPPLYLFDRSVVDEVRARLIALKIA